MTVVVISRLRVKLFPRQNIADENILLDLATRITVTHSSNMCYRKDMCRIYFSKC